VTTKGDFVSNTTVQKPTEQIVAELRTIRTFMLRITGILDTAGADPEAVHYLRTSLTSLDDALDRLERPSSTCTCASNPYSRMTSDRGLIDPGCPVHGVALEAPLTPLQMDRRMDLMMDADQADC
jgi:hypothetical protein